MSCDFHMQNSYKWMDKDKSAGRAGTPAVTVSVLTPALGVGRKRTLQICTYEELHFFIIANGPSFNLQTPPIKFIIVVQFT